MLDVPGEWFNESIEQEFEVLFKLRPYVLKALEDKRGEGVIGSSLEAKLVFETASDDLKSYLGKFGDELADMFIVSQAEVAKVDTVETGLSEEFKDIKVNVVHADGQKCARSWKYTTDVGDDPDYPELSLRCAKIVKELVNA